MKIHVSSSSPGYLEGLIIIAPRHVHLPSREKRQRRAPLAPSFATAGGGVKASLDIGAFGQTKMWLIYYNNYGLWYL